MNGGLVRPPAVAGFFYEADPHELVSRIEWSFTHPAGPGRLPLKTPGSRRSSLGYIVPHAGYIYSGPVAAHSYLRLSEESKPDTIILIGPNHTGLGEPVSIAPWKHWKTPLGRVKVDWGMVEHIVKNSNIIMPSYDAHLNEHSLEVQLPFLQYIYGEDMPDIVPIVAYDQRPETAIAIIEDVTQAAESLGRDITILASTDLNHYDPHEITIEKDNAAIEAMKRLDPYEFYRTITIKQVTVCGPVGVMGLMHLAAKARSSPPVILKHATSGDTSGDRASVVGYLAAQFPRT